MTKSIPWTFAAVIFCLLLSSPVLAKDVSVSFTSSPPGAVLVDGKLACWETPCSASLQSGKHMISIQAASHKVRFETVVLTGDKKIHWTLKPTGAVLSVNSVASGVDVYLDGRRIGATPLKGYGVTPGKHTVKVGSEGCFEPVEKEANFTVGREITLTLSPKAKEGTLTVTAQDGEGKEIKADVYADGHGVGKTPGRFTLSSCVKKLEVKDSGGNVFSQNDPVRAGENVALKAVLKSVVKKDEEPLYKIAVGTSPVRGNAEQALITIVEFSDYQCPFCARAEETMKLISEEYGAQVRIYFRNFPLSMHAYALPAAKAALAARAQGKFWEMHDLLFANNTALTQSDLENYARQLGLDLARFKTDMASKAVEEEIFADVEAAKKAGLRGTPVFFINGRKLAGALPYLTFKMKINRLLQAAQKSGKAGDALYEELTREGVTEMAPEE